MPHDPQRVADTMAWLRRSEDDLRAAEVDLAADAPLLGDAAFHCQQAVEKALKAFLTWHDLPFRKTHDLILRRGTSKRRIFVRLTKALVAVNGKGM